MTSKEVDFSCWPKDVDDAQLDPAREPGKKGRPGAAERERLAGIQARRATYPELIKLPGQVAALSEEVAALEAEVRRLRAGNEYQVNENRRLTRVLSDSQARDALIVKVVADLTFLLGVELYVRPSYGAGLSTMFYTVLGKFQMIFCDGGVQLHFTPADETRAAIEVPLYDNGIPAVGVLILAGHLGLPGGGRVPWHAAGELLKPGSQKEIAAPVPGGSDSN